MNWILSTFIFCFCPSIRNLKINAEQKDYLFFFCSLFTKFLVQHWRTDLGESTRIFSVSYNILHKLKTSFLNFFWLTTFLTLHISRNIIFLVIPVVLTRSMRITSTKTSTSNTSNTSNTEMKGIKPLTPITKIVFSNSDQLLQSSINHSYN